jgi:hypothetical protein
MIPIKHYVEHFGTQFSVTELSCRHLTSVSRLRPAGNSRLRLKCDGTCAETDFVFRRKGRVHLNRRKRQFSRLLAAELCASAVVMLDTPCSEVVWSVLATHSIRQFPLHFPSHASPRTITFQLDFTTCWASRNSALCNKEFVCDFRLPPRSSWELRCPGYCAASIGNFLPTFRDNLSVPSSGFKNPKESIEFLNPADGTQ